MKTVTIDPQDIINALTNQRNAALDEIARQAAIIAALQRELTECQRSEGKDPPAQT